MTNKKLLYGIIVISLISLFLVIWNNYQISGKCGIENCHGLDITCGPNVSEVCDMMYMAGDNCRQYVGCQIVDGKCQLVKNQKFDLCKSCVEKCSVDFKDDQIKFFECESKCTE